MHFQIPHSCSATKDLLGILTNGKLMFHVSGEPVQRTDVKGIDFSKADQLLNPENINQFLRSHSFRVTNSKRVEAFPLLLGGGQIFLKLPEGKTITVDVHSEEPLETLLKQLISDREDIDSETYFLIFNGQKITDEWFYGNQIKAESTVNLCKHKPLNVQVQPPTRENLSNPSTQQNENSAQSTEHIVPINQISQQKNNNNLTVGTITLLSLAILIGCKRRYGTLSPRGIWNWKPTPPQLPQQKI